MDEESQLQVSLRNHSSSLIHSTSSSIVARARWDAAILRLKLSQGSHDPLPEIRFLAEAGEPHSQFLLGFAYIIGFDHLERESVREWAKLVFGSATSAEISKFLFMVELKLSPHIQQTHDYPAAISWYRKAAEQGYSEAQYKLAKIYHRDEFRNDAEAILWFKKYAESLEMYSFDVCCLIGNAHYDGQGVAQDLEEALHWYQRAADNESVEAMFKIGKMYERGEGVLQDQSTASHWYQRAADSVINDGDPNDLGMEVCQTAGCLGYRPAQRFLGDQYSDDTSAQNYDEAVKWYCEASKQGCSTARYRLGLIYVAKSGAIQDPKEALDWRRRAAEEGDPEGQFSVGMRYYWKDRNYLLAYMWVSLAIAGVSGDDRTDVAYCFERISRNMTPAEMAEGQRLASEWKPKKSVSVSGRILVRDQAAE